MHCFKLFSLKKDGSIGPLFINRRQRLARNVWYDAESHPTKGFAYRPGWHCTEAPEAPHLTERGRIWMNVEIDDYTEIVRPVQQGKRWFLANKIRVLHPVFP